MSGIIKDAQVAMLGCEHVATTTTHATASLRDRLAGQAMQSIIATWYSPEQCNFIDAREVSIQAYEIADAMIAARNK